MGTSLFESGGLLDNPALTWDEWSISEALADALWQRLIQRGPKRILELGSGTSTAVFAAYAARNNVQVVSLEHDAAFRERTAGMLEELELRERVDLRLAPCARRTFGRNTFQAYDAALEGTFDFVFVDGPTLALGREATLFFVWQHLSSDWEIWLKDGAREHERRCVRRWKHHFAFSSRLDVTDPRGVLILNPAGAGDRTAEKEEADAPLVSCIMPTHNRRHFVPRAIAQFLEQDYPHRELVIVDDGTDPVEDLILADPRIRYVRSERKRSIGAKRNLACRHARGEIIAHWDDDDWMSPWRLSFQLEQLLAKKADICGIDRIYFYDQQEQKAWQYRYAGSKPWVAGGTLCYRKRVWAAREFADISNGEDTRFVWQAPTSRIAVLDDRDFYVAIIHGQNSSPKKTRSARWHARPIEEVRRVMGEADWARYEFSRNESGSRNHIQIGGRGAERDELADVEADTEENPRITVAIPYFRCKRYLRRSVESILGQTYPHLRVVVINDGDDEPWDVLADIDDPRLVRFDLNENYGRYFADSVVLAATDDPYFVLQDADDWSEPERVAVLLEKVQSRRLDVALPAVYKRHEGNDDLPPSLEAFPDLLAPLTREFEHRAIYPAGLFRTRALKRLGGCYGGCRIGSDSLLLNLLLMTARVAYVDTPLYTYFIRAGGSLTTSPGTGFDSSARDETWNLLNEAYTEIYLLYGEFLAGKINRSTLAELARQICASHISEEDKSALTKEAQRLRSLLESADEKADTVSTRGDEHDAGPIRPTPQALLSTEAVPWTDWTISQPLARALTQRMENGRPRRILELGSGTSTLFLAAYAAQHEATAVSLEHDPVYFEKTRSLLHHHGLQDFVELKYAPLIRTKFKPGHTYSWYRGELSGPFDFVLVDGPPAQDGREGVLFAIRKHLAEDWEIWLKDGRREHERACLRLWSQHVAFSQRFSADDPRGLWILGPPTTTMEAPAIVSSADGARPLVSCIMPTFNRRPFIPQAVAYFQRQDYPDRELIVVDDGTDPVGAILPKDDRIRYIRLDGRKSTGVKRNIACRAARGNVVICWDDDDWYAPGRISHQIEPLLRDEADVSALGASLFYCIRTNCFWTCTPRLHARMFYEQVIGGTLAFWAEDWRRGSGFPDRSIAEDAAFLKTLLGGGARLAKLPAADTFVYIRHGENSWRFQEGRHQDPGGWREASLPSFLPASDLAFYRDFASQADVA